MSYSLSRLMSTATASYGVYALAQPRHLGRAISKNPKEQADYDVLAQTYGARDLTVSALGLFGRSDRTVTAAMVTRIVCDISDGLILSVKAHDDETRNKVLGVTMGWATLNTLALVIDRRNARKAHLI
ncbi:MAG: hypothetical protein ABI776_14330 [Nocardioidaceae bacterium]